MKEAALREWITVQAKSLFDRGYTAGGSGNISAKTHDGVLVTPTRSSFGRLDPERVAKLDPEGNHLGGDPPSTEAALHMAVYRSRPGDRAVVHLHSPHAVAVSCLKGLDPNDVLPALTPYFVMQVGRLPLVPFHPPGSRSLAAAVGKKSVGHRAVLMAHHGTVVAGRDLADAVSAAEELEETARLFLLVKDSDHRTLAPEQVAKLRQRSAIRREADSVDPLLAVTVTFVVKEPYVAEFAAAVQAQAHNSLTLETDCRRFDVCFDPQDRRRVFLYEIYSDPQAFEAHLQTQHAIDFDNRVRDWIDSKAVHTWNRHRG
jgi:ribulose-5-phosphate 4-epimerase/fuculose-1-phosphate aldolase/quinol monooxygenase YgiN